MQTFAMSVAALAAASMGQIDKFESREPSVRYVSSAQIGDVERCLIRIAAPPQIYRQPDRPDDVTVVWSGVSISAGNAAARVDLHREGNGTRVTAWGLEKQTIGCAPRQ